MPTLGDVARRLREPAAAALLVVAVVLAPLAATLVISSEAPAIPPKEIERTPAAVVRVPPEPGPGAARPGRPVLVTTAPAVPLDRDRSADAPVYAAEPDPTDPPAPPSGQPPGTPEPAEPPPAEPPPAPLPDDPLLAVDSTVEDLLEEAQQAVEALPLP